MFDLGWTELLLIAIVALIVVGPRDLPVLFRNVGRWVGKAKGMAREFSQAMNEAADQAGVGEVAKGLKAATNPVDAALDGVREAARDLATGVEPASLSGSDGQSDRLEAGRAEAARKIHAATARAAAERKMREAQEAMARAEAAEAAVGAADEGGDESTGETGTKA